MIKYIIRELQKVFKKKGTLITSIVIVALCLLANLSVMAFTLIYGSDRDGVLGSNVLAFATWCFCLPYYGCIVFADLVFGPKYPNPHIKDNITKDLSRTKIYLGKLIATFILCLTFMVLAFVCLLITTRIFHSDIQTYDVTLFLQNMLISIPLWLAGVAIADLCLFAHEKKKLAYISYLVITLLIPRVIMFFAAEPISFKPFIAVRTILMTQSFGHIPYPADPNRNVTFIVVQGIIYLIIATVTGLAVFNKKQINNAD